MRHELIFRLTALSLTLTALSCSASPSADASNPSNSFNVTWFGATGNGTTDDTNAVKAAITAAGANTGYTVFFPAGTYRITSSVTASGLIVTGQNATILIADTGASVCISGQNPTVQGLAFRATGASTNCAIQVLTGTQNPTVSGNTVGTNFVHGININAASGALVLNNVTSLSPAVQSYAVTLNNELGATVKGNTFNISSNGFGMYIQNSSNVSVTGNQFKLNGGASGSRGLATTGASTLTVSANNFTNGGAISANTIAIESSQNSAPNFSKNTIAGWHTPVASLMDNGPIVSSNTISNAVTVGIDIAQPVGATVQQNVINTIASGSGVAVISSQNGNPSQVYLTQNQISSTGTHGIYASGGANITVAGNLISNAGLHSRTNAVIYTNQPNATSVLIQNNQYKGNTTNLKYFIDAVQGAPISNVSGNMTNTLLPTQVGSER